MIPKLRFLPARASAQRTPAGLSIAAASLHIMNIQRLQSLRTQVAEIVRWLKQPLICKPNLHFSHQTLRWQHIPHSLPLGPHESRVLGNLPWIGHLFRAPTCSRLSVWCVVISMLFVKDNKPFCSPLHKMHLGRSFSIKDALLRPAMRALFSL